MAVANRESLSLDHLALAAFVVVAVSPMSVFDVGFQMSFIAVASILLFVPQMERLLFQSPIWQRQPMRWVSGMVTVSLAAQLGVSPLTAYYFGRFSCYFLLTNFIAIPMAMLLLYGALAMFLLSWQPVVSGLLAYGLGSAAQLQRCSRPYRRSADGEHREYRHKPVAGSGGLWRRRAGMARNAYDWRLWSDAALQNGQ